MVFIAVGRNSEAPPKSEPEDLLHHSVPPICCFAKVLLSVQFTTTWEVVVGKQAKDRPRGLDPSIYFRPRKDGQGGAYHLYFVDPEDKRQTSIKVADVEPGKERDPLVIQEANNNARIQKTALADQGKVLKPADITVSQAWEKFLSRRSTKNPHRKPLKHSSRQDYESQWNNYLEPKFGKLKVVELTEWRVEAFQEWLETLIFEGTAAELRVANAVLRKPITEANAEIRRENKRRRDRNETHLRRKQPLEKLTPLRKFPQPLLSRKRHDNIIITLRGLCTFCFEERWLESNPGEHLRWQGYIKRAFAIPTYAETVQLLKVIDPFFKPLCEMGLYTGCRMGELLAAQWDWIDWGHHRFNVNGSYTHGKLNDTTKSGDARVVPLPQRLMKTLKQWKTECPSETILFPSKAGNRLSLDTFRERTWNPAVAAIGRPEISPHCLRHTYITWVVRQAPKSGATSLAIARVSGHKQISSVEWYVETWNDQLDAIARGFDESKEDLNLRLRGLSTDQLLADTDEMVKKFVPVPKAEPAAPLKKKPEHIKGSGPVLVKKAKPLK